MRAQFSRFLDWFSDFFAHRKGLLPIIGILLIILNLIVNIVSTGWLVNTNLFLHLGIITAIFGFMVAWAL
jgi:hypothetical protein